MIATYEQAVAYLSSLEARGWSLGLDRMRKLVRAADLGDPPGPRFIHVAGTNGKGSVTAYVESLLLDQGLRAGAYYSPYVYDLRERVKIEGRPISREAFTRLMARLQPHAEQLRATEFEMKTALGFAAWQDAGCDWVALEVGLGGRLDATNVVAPAACVIASIGLDHCEVLGSTPAAIAFEKAGILKPGVPAIVGAMEYPDALASIERVAQEVGAPLWRFGHEVRLCAKQGGARLETPAGAFSFGATGLPGTMQPHNAALAIASVAAAGALHKPDAVREAIAATYLPGRFQVESVGDRTVVLDGAHNAQAARHLAATLRQEGLSDCVLLVGMLRGHDPAEFIGPLAPLVREAHVGPIDFHRTYEPAELAAAFAERVVATAHASASDAWQAACDTAGAGGVVLASGSFYWVGEIGRLLGLATSERSRPRPRRESRVETARRV